jgi:hypothetical protein
LLKVLQASNLTRRVPGNSGNQLITINTTSVIGYPYQADTTRFNLDDNVIRP